MKVKYILYGILIGLLPVAYLTFLAPHQNNVLQATSFSDSAGIYSRSVTSVTPPTEAYLFGKPIPLKENWEVRERFEREFYYNYVNADQLVLWWKRLGRWGRMVDSSLDANGLDRDLKYLMVAESGVRNIESASHANGFWQFIPPTAQLWGLRVDEDIDERLDPIKSTAAAMRYLSKLKNQFGDYFLAAAAYNMSESNLSLSLKNQGQARYWDLYLNEETMRYVLRIAVIKEILEHGARYGLRFDSLAPYEPWNVQYIMVTGPVENVADWAAEKGFAYKDVKIYNPWIIGHSLPEGSFSVALPASESARTTLGK
ncbi:MAG TPA: lytic transglycosylase domain-containing protein [Candidatus Kapabacteria bacterium]|nr:lytic transglycosylase domain-containing protein [Candidatus Kapabacteria bacterium]